MKKKRKKGLDLPQFTQPRSTRTAGLKKLHRTHLV